MFNTVIVAFDGSERAIDALVLAEALMAPGGELVVCCVHHYDTLSARVNPMEPAIDRQAAEACVAQASGLLRRGSGVTTMVLAGASTAATLELAAARGGADLLVLGSSHRGVLGRVLVGSVSQEALHGAGCPVAIAPAGLHRDPAGIHLTRIAVAYDLASPPLEALNQAATLASAAGAELELIAVADIASARAGGASDELLKATQSLDLMVLGRRRRGAVRRLLRGSVCDVIVRAAACPVLIVPPSSQAEDRAQREGEGLADVQSPA